MKTIIKVLALAISLSVTVVSADELVYLDDYDVYELKTDVPCDSSGEPLVYLEDTESGNVFWYNFNTGSWKQGADTVLPWGTYCGEYTVLFIHTNQVPKGVFHLDVVLRQSEQDYNIIDQYTFVKQ